MAVGSLRKQRGTMIGLLLAVSAGLAAWLYNSILSPSSPQASSAAKARGLLLKGQFPVAKLGTADFEELIGLPPLVPARHSRSYGLFLLLNTMAPEFQCPSCKIIDEEFHKMASLITPAHRLTRNIHFASIELKNNRELFMRMKVEHVPSLLFLPATTDIASSSSPQEYISKVRMFDIRNGILAADLARFVETTAQISVPQDYRAKIIWALAILGAAMAAGALVVRFVRLQTFLSPRLWAILSCVFVLIMCSGLMWVRIRGAPLTAYDRQGQPQYISNTLQSQLGLETYLISILNAAASLSTILLTSKIPKIQDRKYSRPATALCAVVVVCALSAQVVMFRRKMGGYPFRLLWT